MPTRPALTLAALLSLAAGGARSAPSLEQQAERDREALARIVPQRTARICSEAPLPGHARCHAQMVVDDSGHARNTLAPSGLTPADITSAYNIPPSGGSGVTVALIDANDDPNAESDLAVYRSQFGLPACTSANGCFRKVNEHGDASPLPSPDQSWSGEISLDLDAVSAACPNCKILLLEASSTSTLDLGTAVVTAASMGAAAISNSYGGDESILDPLSDSTYYDHPGILITASTGDSGYGPQYPATSTHMLAVGGTSLVPSGNSRGWTEGAWSSGGSGCSAYESKPSYQVDKGCGKRAVADISAVADPNTGLAVYDTYGSSGWVVYGGTSLSSPLVAAIFAHVGAAGVSDGFPYTNPNAFYDVLTGSNGSCGGSYLCTAGAGYDGPTGIGTPDAAEILSIVGPSSGSGGTSSSCGPGSVEVLGACTPSFGCNSGGQEGLVAWSLSALFAAIALVRTSRARRRTEGRG